MKKTTEEFWTLKYKEGTTGWDIGYPSTPLKTFIDQLTDKNQKILIPGAGNAHEAAYLWNNGFRNVYILDISKVPLQNFAKNHNDFPLSQLIHENFFEHDGQYDLIFEQTFFCSFPPTPENRKAYAKKMSALLNPSGKLVGLWFNFPLTDDMEKRPFGGSKEEYMKYFNPFFSQVKFEKCYNSIPPRQGNELFGILNK